MHTTTVYAAAVCGLVALAGAGAAGCGRGDEAAEAQPATSATATEPGDATVQFPDGELTKVGDYRIRVASQAAAERLCGAARAGGWPERWAAYEEVRFSFRGPDLYCVPDR